MFSVIETHNLIFKNEGETVTGMKVTDTDFGFNLCLNSLLLCC